MFTLYTDGSGHATGGSAGCGVVLLWDHSSVSETLPDWRIEVAYGCGFGTHNVAELKAILVGFRLLYPKAPLFTHYETRKTTFDQPFAKKNDKLVLISDSEYALYSVSGKYNGSKNKTLIYRCRVERRNWKKISYKHVRGHTNVKWNERADKLAAEARDASGKNHNRQGFARFDIFVGERLWLNLDRPRHPKGFLALNVPRL